MGVSDGHDAGACLINMEGELLFAASEERFSRVKHQRGIPKQALQHIKLLLQQWDALENIKLIAVGGIFRKEKRLLELKKYLTREFPEIPLIFLAHHASHAASAYFTSGHRQSLVITLDAAGDGLSGSVSIGKNGILTQVHDISYIDSIGDFFATITELLGYQPMSDEHKVASMAAYSSDVIPDEEMKAIIDYDSKRLCFVNELEVVGSRATKKLSFLSKKYDSFTIAKAAQYHLVKLVTAFFETVHDLYHVNHVSFAGGVAGNVQLNMTLRECDFIDDLWIFPHMGDGGLCVGAALEALSRLKMAQGQQFVPKRLSYVYLGPSISQKDINDTIKEYQETITVKCIDPSVTIPKLLQKNAFLGLMHGRMEFGPRSLGNRTLLANPTIEKNQRVLNQRKGRPWFQPFAPTILSEHGQNYLLNYMESPFMTIAFRVTNLALETVPAVIHADGTTRPQTIKNENPHYKSIIESCLSTIGVPLVLNTSLNVHGEPIVCSARDGIITLKKGLIDALLINDLLITRKR